MEIKKILEKLARGEITVATAEQELRLYSIEYVENKRRTTNTLVNVYCIFMNLNTKAYIVKLFL